MLSYAMLWYALASLLAFLFGGFVSAFDAWRHNEGTRRYVRAAFDAGKIVVITLGIIGVLEALFP